MPELPEVEIAARRLGSALAGAEVESVLTPGMVAMKTVSPRVEALIGMRIVGVGRVGKMFTVEFDRIDPPSAGSEAASQQCGGEGSERLCLLVHLMSAGRLQVFEKRASLKDRRSRILIRLADGRELRLREFGTKQRAWAKLMPSGELAGDEMVATLGPEAWPAPPTAELTAAIAEPRHLHPLLRDQRRDRRHRPLVGRRDPLGGAALAVQEGLRARARRRSSACARRSAVLGDAIDHYEEVIGEIVPDKLPMPLRVHRREGEPCPRCGTTIEAVFFAEHQTNYCPAEQTGGRVLKDRRLSRLLK